MNVDKLRMLGLSLDRVQRVDAVGDCRQYVTSDHSFEREVVKVRRQHAMDEPSAYEFAEAGMRPVDPAAASSASAMIRRWRVGSG